MSNEQEAPWTAAWRAWTELASKGFKAAAAEQSFTPHAAAASGFAEPYLAFARVIQQLLKAGGGADFAQRFVDTLKSAAQYGAAPAGNEDFLNVFLRTAPSALLGAFPDANAGQAWRQWTQTLGRWTRELLALPLVGPQREWQASLQAVQRALLTEHETRAVVDEHYRLASRAALQAYADALQDADGPPITTVRALYDAWIDAAEAAYARRVMSDDYGRDFAAWVNAGSELRLAMQALGARLTTLFDAPGREEINALLERQQAMQRELAALRAERDAMAAPARPASPIAPDRAEVAVVTEPAPAAKARNRAPRAAKGASEKPVKPPRVRPPQPRKGKPTRDEFDIAHILDAGK